MLNAQLLRRLCVPDGQGTSSCASQHGAVAGAATAPSLSFCPTSVFWVRATSSCTTDCSSALMRCSLGATAAAASSAARCSAYFSWAALSLWSRLLSCTVCGRTTQQQQQHKDSTGTLSSSVWAVSWHSHQGLCQPCLCRHPTATQSAPRKWLVQQHPPTLAASSFRTSASSRRREESSTSNCLRASSSVSSACC